MNKATIFIDRGGEQTPMESVEVLFNPNQYTISSENNYQMHTPVGESIPIAQFINGEAKTLSMELFFDTYAQGNDVRDYTRRITSLQNIESGIKVPPLCIFVWGSVKFVGVVVSVSENYTMFLASGIPVRATLNVTFKQASRIDKKHPNQGRKSADRTKNRKTKGNERIDTISAKELNNPNRWRLIANANNLDNPRNIPAGTELIIPRLD